LKGRSKAMNDKIWKFVITPDAVDIPNEHHEMIVQMPWGARVLHVGVQQDKVCLWAEVNPDNRLCPRKFYSVGTGFGTVPRGDIAKFLGTVQCNGGFVWHIYEEHEGL
jgi:hypothetical protein